MSSAVGDIGSHAHNLVEYVTGLRVEAVRADLASVVEGRTLTSYPSLRTDVRNAGGEWVDEEVVVDDGVITSRNPDDLDAFCETLVEEFGRAE